MSDQNMKSDDLVILKKNIRMGTMPNSPLILKNYLEIPAKANSTLVEKRAHYEEKFRLLIDTIADDCVVGHWRCLCLDHINMPLRTLQSLSNTPNSRRYVTGLYTELRAISNYFQVSMTYHPNQTFSGEQN